MQCLTDQETYRWLENKSIPIDPYSGNSPQKLYLQFKAPQTHRVIDSFARCYYLQILEKSDYLLHMTDWAHYQPSDMLTMTAIREKYGEKRRLIDAPGYLVDPKHTELSISLFGLSVSFQWNCYLYSTKEQTTLLNWEGEIFDFWTNCQNTKSIMLDIIQAFGLQELHKP